MEKRINFQLEKYQIQFKDQLKKKISELGFEDKEKTNELLEYIYEYDRLVLTKEDFSKRVRVQNNIPTNNRCIAIKSNAQQCTRRRKDCSEYCGTHYKTGGIDEEEGGPIRNMEVFAREIDGIVYYIDEYQNVYRTEDILNEKTNPQIIAKYQVLSGGRYTIREFLRV
jgi:hypothetical protein